MSKTHQRKKKQVIFFLWLKFLKHENESTYFSLTSKSSSLNMEFMENTFPQPVLVEKVGFHVFFPATVCVTTCFRQKPQQKL